MDFPHLHILVSQFLSQSWLSSRWAELGGGEVVDIRHINHLDRAAHYLEKYLTKNALSFFPDGVHQYGSSADLDLDVRSDSDDSEDSWWLVMDDYLVVRE